MGSNFLVNRTRGFGVTALAFAFEYTKTILMLNSPIRTWQCSQFHGKRIKSDAREGDTQVTCFQLLRPVSLSADVRQQRLGSRLLALNE